MWLSEDPDCLGKESFTALAQARISAAEGGLNSAMHSGCTEMKDLVKIKEVGARKEDLEWSWLGAGGLSHSCEHM